jgi:hypothetical protein
MLVDAGLPEEFPNPAPNPPLPLADDEFQWVEMCEFCFGGSPLPTTCLRRHSRSLKPLRAYGTLR